MKFLNFFTAKKNLVLFDIDGVLADDRHRVRHAIEREWAKYFDPQKMAQDGVWEQGRERISRYAADPKWEIQYLTGRRVDRKEVTLEWLKLNEFPDGKLNQRGLYDHRQLAEVKKTFIQRVLASKNYKRVVLFDDDPEVIRVVGEAVGFQHVVHCTWHVKEKALIRTAKS